MNAYLSKDEWDTDVKNQQEVEHRCYKNVIIYSFSFLLQSQKQIMKNTYSYCIRAGLSQPSIFFKMLPTTIFNQ